MTPWAQLAAAFAGFGVNVYPAPQSNISAPAIVIRPDEPWISKGPSVQGSTERYAVVLVASAGSPADGIEVIHTLAHMAIDALPDGWALDSVGRVLIDETTGTPFLAAAVRLIYRVCEGD